uniref:LOW QUALITY PROTEIN: GRIP and coiled-coil domain-containing protein 1-like n=1 Tax=Styela clava TaxID=7725 RepID=UPI00193984BA|nr:LOW QUALITY PROTEIN: GRIP and coiled-coil domain-containing protein 1-like [Styela clava]
MFCFVCTYPYPGTITLLEKENSASDVSHQDEAEGENDSTVEELKNLQTQIATLTMSLSTVTEEKSKIVATYQAEKRKLKQETDTQLLEMRKELGDLRKKNQELEEEFNMAKEKIRLQQNEREQEQSTNSIMLRELQKILNDERIKNEQISGDLQEARKMAQKAASVNKKTESNEKDLNRLMDELETAYDKLRLAKEEAKKPQPIVGRLQKEIAEIKAAHRIQLESERMQFISTENRLKKVEKEAEERVASLENRITQLSNQMGGYERSKTNDQDLIRSLKERIAQSEAENRILAKQAAVSANKDFGGSVVDENNMDVEYLKEQISKYKGLLKHAAEKCNDPFAMFEGKSDENEYNRLYMESQQELRQVKDEFEKYKVRAQNVLKAKRETGITSGENVANMFTQRQFQEIKNELEEVRERHFHLRSHCDGLEEQQNKLIKEQGEELLRCHLSHQNELKLEKENYSARVLDLEQEMRSQRERTVMLLAEKDKEIQSLQAYSTACHREYQSEYGGIGEPNQETSTSSDNTHYGHDKLRETQDSVFEIVNQGSMHDTTMIHYAEQMARKDVLINGLRRHKKQLELQIRQLQDAIMTKDEKNSRGIAELQEKIANFDRSKSRENANLEYLKNVMYQYLTTNRNQSAKSRMLGAVTTILQFSPDEIKNVRKKF